ncbi:MAG: hypothetical protein V4557_17630 [Bacteroidota bacterium]
MLTKEQVDRLFDFCKRHYVDYYDVQVELVDHLANAIEEKMASNEQVNFEEALDSVYAGFGINGFSGIVASRTTIMRKHCRKLQWKMFLSYFTWPKAAMTICLFVVLFFLGRLLSIIQAEILVSALGFSLFLFELYTITFYGRTIKKQTGKLLMTEVGATPIFWIWILLPTNMMTRAFSPFSENILRNDMHFPEYVFIVIVFVLSLLVLLSYLAMMKQLHKEAREKYPKAFV